MQLSQEDFTTGLRECGDSWRHVLLVKAKVKKALRWPFLYPSHKISCPIQQQAYSLPSLPFANDVLQEAFPVALHIPCQIQI